MDRAGLHPSQLGGQAVGGGAGGEAHQQRGAGWGSETRVYIFISVYYAPVSRISATLKLAPVSFMVTTAASSRWTEVAVAEARDSVISLVTWGTVY